MASLGVRQSAPLEHGPSEVRADILKWDSAQRVLDLLLTIMTAPIWLPGLLTLMALKLVLDGRPVLFHHVRLGRQGRPFVLHKLRTTPAAFKPRPQDWPDAHFPPRTRFGRWLRRFDLDELPQLWNVLRGEMSLVGPRPETPFHSERFALRWSAYAQRLAVRPGLTGWAQVRGWRGNSSIEQRLAADLEYVARRGFGLYFRILMRTLTSELKGWLLRA